MPPPASSALGRVDETGHRLPRQARLRKRSEFLAVQARGRAVRGRHLVAAILENGLPHRRLGLTVSSRVGNAVARNRVKRWLREIFRHHRNALPPGVDVVLIARPGTPQLGHRRLEAEFVTLAERLRAGEGERGRPKSRRRSGTGRRS